MTHLCDSKQNVNRSGRDRIIETIVACGGSRDLAEAAAAVYDTGYVCVPKVPTKDMLDAAYYEALGEDAAGVWREMLRASDGEITSEEILG